MRPPAPHSSVDSGRQPTEGRSGCLITVDVEDHGPAGSTPRFAEALEPLLDALRSSRLTATFFVVGSLASRWKSELASLLEEGHELALHGHTHRFINRLSEDEFREDLRRGVGTLEDVVGVSPIGYRAPYFSLTRSVLWAPDHLQAAGFVYSSSVLPAWNPQAGFPGAPRSAYRWPNGLIEFPVPVFGVGPLRLPLLGGAYVRLVPRIIVALAASQSRRRQGQWTYAHPYDFDVSEPFTRLPGQQWWVTRLLFARRGLMLSRVLGLASDDARTLRDLASDPQFADKLPTFSP